MNSCSETPDLVKLLHERLESAGGRPTQSLCGTSKDRALVFYDGGRWYCHKCRSGGNIVRHALNYLVEAHKPRREVISTEECDPLLWPMRAAMVWARLGFHPGFSGGVVYNPMARRLRISHTDAMGTFSQMRAVFPDQHPKYLTEGVRVYLRAGGGTGLAVYVEDMSSFKHIERVIDPAVVSVICLLGTKLRVGLPEVVTFKRVLTWLDGDEAGQRCASEIAALCHSWGVQHMNHTGKEPKQVGEKYIRSTIQRALQ